MGELIDLKDQPFGRLVVVSRAPNKPNDTRARWLCRCECGGMIVTDGKSLRNGFTQSCGCYRKEKTREMALKHGHCKPTFTGGGKPRHGHSVSDFRTPTHNAWHSMRSRCLNPTNQDFHYYGGRGITICPRWLESFENFLEDMGERPPGLTLERIDVNGPYSKENCTWASRKTQGRNRRDTIRLTKDGVSRPIGDWAELLGLTYGCIKARRQRGLSDEECLAPITRYSVPIVRKKHAA